MLIRTTLEWPDPDDSGETESFSDALFLEFTDAAPSDANSGTTTESCSSLLVEFSDRDCERRSFNQDEPS